MLMTETKEALVQNLIAIIKLSRRKPYLPFWGEVLDLLLRLKYLSEENKPLYEINPVGDVVYDRERRAFLIRVPGMDIVMKEDEMVNAIIEKGLFLPKQKQGAL